LDRQAVGCETVGIGLFVSGKSDGFKLRISPNTNLGPHQQFFIPQQLTLQTVIGYLSTGGAK
jgi:hypothetical protein